MAVSPQILLALAAIFTATNGLDTFGYWLPGATGPIGATRTTATASTASTASTGSTGPTASTPSTESTAAPTSPPAMVFDDTTFLSIVNDFRSLHSASELITNTTLKDKAEACADFYAKNAELSNNTAAITSCEELDEDELDVFYTGANSTTVTTMVMAWYKERCGTGTAPKAYNFTSPSSVTDYKHFTQLVWNATTEVGCSYSTVTNQNPSQEGNYVTVCVFSPGGNIRSDRVPPPAYKSNVVDSTPSSLLTC